MSFLDVAKNLTPDVYLALKKSLELGRWPDGRQMSREQKEVCMDAIIAYEASNDVPEQERVGYIARDKPTPCATPSTDKTGAGVWTPEAGGNETRH